MVVPRLRSAPRSVLIAAAALLVAAGFFAWHLETGWGWGNPVPTVGLGALLLGAVGVVAGFTWARWLAILLGIGLMGFGSFIVFFVTAMATGMGIEFTSPLFFDPVGRAAVVIAAGLAIVLGLARSGNWFKQPESRQAG